MGLLRTVTRGIAARQHSSTMIDSRSIEKNILPKHHFVDRLRVEKRRADRSKSPLSVILLSLQNGAVSDQRLTQEFLKSIHENTRETDIKGWVDHDVIGLILPDTDEGGVRHCGEKIANRSGDIKFSMLTGTYPNHLFERLLAEEQGDPDLSPLDLDEPIKIRRSQIALKRVMDIAGSLVGLLLFSPLMFLTAIAIKITSSGPIIFKQFRFGEKGIHFAFYKFRSMQSNADDQIHREYVTNLIKGDLEKINQGDEGTPLYKMKSDPRVTAVGRIIRKTSIDELPQFLNVLKGEMSLVGPRPPIPYEVEKYEPWHLRRILEVKPGITGLWQVDGRSITSFDDMVRLDLRYVQNWSLWLDIKIILKTLKVFIRPNGAH
ncbi:MAG: exopolysaccharide biosynthesis polyprenyl glycosylphosphotransferase [bacterium]